MSVFYTNVPDGTFSSWLKQAMHVSEHIQAGTCFVNCYNKTDAAAPFGGFKQSGFGKDLGMSLNHVTFGFAL